MMTDRKTINDIRKLSQQSRITLFGKETTAFTDVTADIRENDLLSVTASGIVCDREALMVVEPLRMNQPMKNALDMIRAQSEYHIPFLLRREASKLSKIKGGESVLRAEKEALKAGIIRKHLLPRAKTEICLWEITDCGYELLKQSRPRWKSKGEYKHKFCAHRIAHTYELLGFNSEIEHRRPDGKLVDLCLKKNDKMLFIEVCASWPVSKELVNVEKDLQSYPFPDEIILAVTERKMKEPLQKAISELNQQVRPVKVMVAGDLINVLEIK